VSPERSDELSEEAAALAAARAGDQRAFAALAERHRRALRVHCYRMLGSFDDAEDVVQETLLRAWRARAGFEGRSLLRTWLYKIATNLCLDALARAPRRVLPQDVVPPVTAATPASEARAAPAVAREIAWLGPYPDSELEAPPGWAAEDAGSRLAAPAAAQPEALVAARETVELAFLAALQHLPPRQRASLILADVVGWSAAEVAEQLEVSVASVTSALQRAHQTMRAHQLSAGPAGAAPVGRAALGRAADEERAALRVFMAAWEQGDVAELTRLLRDDARWAMPPARLWFDGREAISRLLALYPPHWQGRAFKMAVTGANRQPAAASYLRGPGEAAYRFTGIHVLRVDGGQIAEITTFAAELCAAFRLPREL
jgi:RNA polymerase sigma-70 factor (ECF subfamily)